MNIYVHISFSDFPLIPYYKISSIVPRDLQNVLTVSYISLFLIQQYVYVKPKPLIYPFPTFPFVNHKFVFCVSGSLSVLYYNK